MPPRKKTEEEKRADAERRRTAEFHAALDNPEEQWRPLDGIITSNESNRSQELYCRVIDQFDVTRSRRYMRTRYKTFCNVFVRDVTRSMGCEIPTWVSPRDMSRPVRPSDDRSKAVELDCHGMLDWLTQYATEHGWIETGPAQCIQMVALGMPAVVFWRNPDGPHGHCAMVRPGETTAHKPIISQAGKDNFQIGFVSNGFGRKFPLRWFFHR